MSRADPPACRRLRERGPLAQRLRHRAGEILDAQAYYISGECAART
ncbi:hypothetical protein [Nocardia higoensis]|nr:hypothetical protein [Nocardia higoensis]